MSEPMVTCPPDRIRTVCCKVVMTDPKPGDVYYLDLRYFLMTCPECGQIVEHEKVPAGDDS